MTDRPTSPPGASGAPGVRRPRADAERNRVRLLEAARDAFSAEADATVSLDAIARDAGVGIGTLYRHFPTREALVAALYARELAELCASAESLLRQLGPEAALRAWMDRFRGYVTVKRGMGESLSPVLASGSFDLPEIRRQMAAALAPILAAGAAEGSLDPGVRADDVVAAVVGMFSATSLTGGPDQLARLLDLLAGALRAP